MKTYISNRVYHTVKTGSTIKEKTFKSVQPVTNLFSAYKCQRVCWLFYKREKRFVTDYKFSFDHTTFFFYSVCTNKIVVVIVNRCTSRSDVEGRWLNTSSMNANECRKPIQLYRQPTFLSLSYCSDHSCINHHFSYDGETSNLWNMKIYEYRFFRRLHYKRYL